MNERVQAAVAELVRVRRAQAAKLPALPPSCAPLSEAEAYAMQDGVGIALQAEPAAWKATLLTADRGLSAPIYRHTLLHSPAVLSGASTATQGTRRWGVEPEVAFTLQRALPPLPDGQAYSRADLTAAVASAHAALEICVSRSLDFNQQPALERIADNFMNEALVLGAPLRTWRELPLADLALSLCLSGQQPIKVRAGHPLKDPLLPLIWIANHMSSRGRALPAGAVITTGSHAGIHWLEADGRARAEFAGLGAAEIHFTP